MAAGGVQDFALAKRKAARQLGANDTQNLPNNTEIEQVLEAMREFAAFDPRLTAAPLKKAWLSQVEELLNCLG